MTTESKYTPEQLYQARAKLSAQIKELESGYKDTVIPMKDNLRKIDAVLSKVGTHTADSLTEEYVAIRDQRSELKADFDSEDKQLKDRMTMLEARLLEMLDGIGADSMRTSHGTAYVSEKARYNATDWPAYYKVMQELERWDMLEKRVAQKVVENMLEEGVDIPGLNKHSERTVVVRRS